MRFFGDAQPSHLSIKLFVLVKIHPGPNEKRSVAMVDALERDEGVIF
ncbi:hypothetical protein DSCW_21700 [Desulfosarcina widdelii]|uniref:Uncharacterized protein n=1 Tax=Desulfosarcina widdelii TaxID=947919 RepID=A0A5K7Z476_9BACT|nr:hypothetical protein [Desulfosarcina widdelii]BBO74753.1 hypothetical protein DSCW_21700 [Desulfosarcina widdelii]